MQIKAHRLIYLSPEKLCSQSPVQQGCFTYCSQETKQSQTEATLAIAALCKTNEYTFKVTLYQWCGLCFAHALGFQYRFSFFHYRCIQGFEILAQQTVVSVSVSMLDDNRIALSFMIFTYDRLPPTPRLLWGPALHLCPGFSATALGSHLVPPSTCRLVGPPACRRINTDKAHYEANHLFY